MQRHVLAGAIVLALASPALGQSTSETTGSTTAIITIAPEQRTKIREYVVEKRVKPVKIEKRVEIGATLPADVELMAVPSEWGPEVSRYRYVYSDDRIVLVEPSSRRVIQVIE